jgi:hypothetical protein
LPIRIRESGEANAGAGDRAKLHSICAADQTDAMAAIANTIVNIAGN